MYYLGVTLAIISCLACGTMEVLVSACHSVSTSVLVSWSAITGESLFSSQISHSIISRIHHCCHLLPPLWNISTLIKEHRLHHLVSVAHIHRSLTLWSRGLHHPHHVTPAGIPQPGGQSPVSGAGARLHCPDPAHWSPPRHHLHHWQPPHHPRCHPPRHAGETRESQAYYSEVHQENLATSGRG